MRQRSKNQWKITKSTGKVFLKKNNWTKQKNCKFSCHKKIGLWMFFYGFIVVVIIPPNEPFCFFLFFLFLPSQRPLYLFQSKQRLILKNRPCTPTKIARKKIPKNYIVQYIDRQIQLRKKQQFKKKKKSNVCYSTGQNWIAAVICMFILFNFCSLTNVYLID